MNSEIIEEYTEQVETCENIVDECIESIQGIVIVPNGTGKIEKKTKTKKKKAKIVGRAQTSNTFFSGIPVLDWNAIDARVLSIEYKDTYFPTIDRDFVLQLKQNALQKTQMDSIFLDQGDDKWKDARKLCTYTGSMVDKITGLQQTEIYRRFTGKSYPYNETSFRDSMLSHISKETAFDTKAKLYMKYGKIQEPAGKFMFLHYLRDKVNPNAKVYESGLWIMDWSLLDAELVYDCAHMMQISTKVPYEEILKQLPIIGSSPDLICDMGNSEPLVVEIKCKTFFRPNDPNPNGDIVFGYCAPTPFSTIPFYYIAQVQLELLCTGCQNGYFVSYGNIKGTNIFEIKINWTFCECLLMILCHLHQKTKELKTITNPTELTQKIDQLYTNLVTMDVYKTYLQQIQKITEETRAVLIGDVKLTYPKSSEPYQKLERYKHKTRLFRPYTENEYKKMLLDLEQ